MRVCRASRRGMGCAQASAPDAYMRVLRRVAAGPGGPGAGAGGGRGRARGGRARGAQAWAPDRSGASASPSLRRQMVVAEGAPGSRSSRGQSQMVAAGVRIAPTLGEVR